MKIKTIDNMHGYFLTEKQFKELQLVEVENQKLYFLPCKWKRTKSFDKDEVIRLMHKYDDKKKIIAELDCTLLQLNNFLNRNFGCMNIDKVREETKN